VISETETEVKHPYRPPIVKLRMLSPDEGMMMRMYGCLPLCNSVWRPICKVIRARSNRKRISVIHKRRHDGGAGRLHDLHVNSIPSNSIILCCTVYSTQQSGSQQRKNINPNLHSDSDFQN